MDLTDYFNFSNIPEVNFSSLIDEGLLNLGFTSYLALFGDFFWGLFFGIIGVAIYTWKNNVYALVGYLIAIMALTRIIIPYGLADLLMIILGLAASGLIYRIFIKNVVDEEGGD